VAAGRGGLGARRGKQGHAEREQRQKCREEPPAPFIAFKSV
jgi:hypothetical protein